MFTPSFATPLSFLVALSLLMGSFSATAADATPLANFKHWATPVALPQTLVAPLQGNKLVLADIVKPSASEPTVLVHLWAPNCAPCAQEMKALDSAARALQQKGLRVIAVAQDPDGPISVPAFVKRYSLSTINAVVDTTRQLQMALAPQGLPVTYLLSAKGEIIAEHLGPVDWHALAAP